MQLYILDRDYAAIGVIDEAESVLWNKKYNDVGECEIYVPHNAAYFEMLKNGHYVFRYDDDMFCKIQKVAIDTDEENGNYITATAQDASVILSGRIVRWQVAFSGTVARFIEKVLTDNVINPEQRQRRIENFEIDTSNFSEFAETIEASVFTDDLLELIKSVCKSHNIGFRLSFNIETRRLVFRLYKGKNRASEVEFSPQFANILSSNYLEDDGNYKNVAYVGYKSADEKDEKTYLLSVYKGDTEPQGDRRHEIYIDGTGTSRDITYEELLQMFPTVRKLSRAEPEDEDSTGSTGKEKLYWRYYIVIDGEVIDVATSEQDVPEDGEEAAEEQIKVTDYTYLLLIRSLGDNALAEHNGTKEFNGVVDTIGSYEYKADYDLGDIVKVINDYGIEAEARITEAMESDDNEDGHVVEPTFEFLN